jgi:hypothetical protein
MASQARDWRRMVSTIAREASDGGPGSQARERAESWAALRGDELRRASRIAARTTKVDNASNFGKMESCSVRAAESSDSLTTEYPAIGSFLTTYTQRVSELLGQATKGVR